MDPLGLVAAFLLKAQGFTADGFQVLQCLLAGVLMLLKVLTLELGNFFLHRLKLKLGLLAVRFMLICVLPLELNSAFLNLLDLFLGLLAVRFVLFGVLTLQFNRLLIQLLATLQGLLLQLLTAGRELLLHLCQLALHLLFELGALLTRRLKQLLTLLAGLITHLIHLPLSFLANGGIVHKLFALALGLINDLLCALAGGVDELVAPINQLGGTLKICWQSLPYGIEKLHGICFIHQTSAGERESTAFQNNFLQLVELIENGEPDVVHLSWLGKPN